MRRVVFFAVLLSIGFASLFLLSGCDGTSEKLDCEPDLDVTTSCPGSGPDLDPDKISLSPYMFDGFRVELGDVVYFVRELENDQEIIMLDQLDAFIHKFYIGHEFIYFMFRSHNSSLSETPGNTPNFNRVNYRSQGEEFQSFVIHKETGFVYSLAGLSDNVTIFDAEILKAAGRFFTKGIVDGNLVFTDLIPNQNIIPKSVWVDRYGTIFVLNNMANQVVGNIVYLTSSSDNYGFNIGSDGRFYRIWADITIAIRSFRPYVYNPVARQWESLVSVEQEVRVTISNITYIFGEDGRLIVVDASNSRWAYAVRTGFQVHHHFDWTYSHANPSVTTTHLGFIIDNVIFLHQEGGTTLFVRDINNWDVGRTEIGEFAALTFQGDHFVGIKEQVEGTVYVKIMVVNGLPIVAEYNEKTLDKQRKGMIYSSV